MRVVKPRRLGVLTKPVLYAGRCYCCIATTTFFPFDRPEEIAFESDMWGLLAPLLSDLPFDTCDPKATGEYFVLGGFHAAGGTPMLSAELRVAVGALEKRLVVTGDREWQERRDGAIVASDPLPFTSMPIAWPLAFGGPAFAENAVGRGHWPKGVAQARYPLPNIEYPQDRLTLPWDEIAPAGFLPTAIDRPSRRKRAGTYDAYWAEHHCPGLAEDVDWAFFQAAPEDQWFDGFLAGSESFEIENMHPEQPLLRGRVPPVRARCLVRLKQPDGGLETVEVGMVTDTLWLLPEQRHGITVHRGWVEVTEEDLRDVEQLLVAFEWLNDPPRPAAYYEEALDGRLDRDTGLQRTLKEEELYPNGWVEPAPERLETLKPRRPVAAETLALPPRLQKVLDARKAEIDEALLAAGLPSLDAHTAAAADRPFDDPRMETIRQESRYLAETPPTGPQDAPERRARVERIRQAVMALTNDRLTEEEQRAREACARVGLNYDELVEEGRRKAPKTPKELMDFVGAELQKLEQRHPDEAAIRDAVRAAAPLPLQQSMDAHMAVYDALEIRQKSLFGHLMDMPEPPPPEAALAGRANVGAALAAGGSLRGLPLSGLDLSGLDLRRTDLTELDLTGADLRGADLTGARLSRTCLAGADLSDACLAEVTADEANFGNAILHRTDFAGADLTLANLAKCRGEDTRFPGAKLAVTNLTEAALVRPDFAGAALEGTVFMETAMQQPNFSDACLKTPTFLSAKLDGACFDRAMGEQILLVSSTARDASFVDAELIRFTTMTDVDLSGADFTRAKMDQANLRGAMLYGCRFTDAHAEQADFSEADARHCDFSRTWLRKAMMMRTDLTGTRLDGADLMHGNLMKARLVNASARSANFYGAETMKMVLEDSDLTDAIVEGTKLMGPRLP